MTTHFKKLAGSNMNADVVVWIDICTKLKEGKLSSFVRKEIALQSKSCGFDSSFLHVAAFLLNTLSIYWCDLVNMARKQHLNKKYVPF